MRFGDSVGEITHFIAMAFDLTDHGLVAGEPFKCRSPAAAIERASHRADGRSGYRGPGDTGRNSGTATQRRAA